MDRAYAYAAGVPATVRSASATESRERLCPYNEHMTSGLVNQNIISEIRHGGNKLENNTHPNLQQADTNSKVASWWQTQKSMCSRCTEQHVFVCRWGEKEENTQENCPAVGNSSNFRTFLPGNRDFVHV